MPRSGITYEQVAQAAAQLLQEGRVGADGNPTLQALREQLGTGSPNTIHAHLKAWKATREAAQPAAVPELPAALVRAFREAMDGVRAEAQAALKWQLAAAQSEAKELARAGSEVEANLAELESVHASLGAECDQLLGRFNALEEEHKRCKQELTEEKRAAEKTRLDLRDAQLQREAAQAQLEQLRADAAKLQESLDAERSARVAAERELAGALAVRDALSERVSDTKARSAQLERECAEGREALSAERTQRSVAERELAVARAEAQAAIARATDLQQRESALRTALDERDQALRQR